MKEAPKGNVQRTAKDLATTLKEKAKAAKAQAMAGQTEAPMAEVDEKLLAKGRAIRKK